MERGSDKHGARQDEALAKDVEGMVRGTGTTHAEEWKDPEPPADDDPEAGWMRPQTTVQGGIPAATLSADDLLRELAHLHETRNTTLRHGSSDALMHHSQRTAELEGEYLRRFPQREVDPERLRVGARART